MLLTPPSRAADRGCCPFSQGICCPDGAACCPASSPVCDTDTHTCKGGPNGAVELQQGFKFMASSMVPEFRSALPSDTKAAQQKEGHAQSVATDYTLAAAEGTTL